MKKLRVIFLIFLRLLTLFAGVIFLFFLFSWITEFRPQPVEKVPVYWNCSAQDSASSSPCLPDTLKVLTWNIGYGGLGDNMDFFYDGGTQVRTSRERTFSNLARIIRTLRQSNADIILLQEVDRNAHRSYGVDEAALIAEALSDYNWSFAYNYVAGWVPIPFREPIGRVASGVMILSRCRPLEALRIQYPSKFSFPTRIFNLKRCLLSTRFLTAKGDTLLINNTHNTAFDTGEMRTQEDAFLADWLSSMHAKGIFSITGGDWNQLPPEYIPSAAELSNPYFIPQPIDEALFLRVGEFVYDPLAPSLRYLDRPYKPTTKLLSENKKVRGNQQMTTEEEKKSIADTTKPTRTLTDFYLLGGKITPLTVETLPLEFCWSDHNPVITTMRIRH